MGILQERDRSPQYGRNSKGPGPSKSVRLDEGRQMTVEANDQCYDERPAVRRIVFLFSDVGVVPDEGKKTPKDVRIGNGVTACLTIRMTVNCGMNRELPVAGVPDGYGNPVIRFKNNDPARPD